jgi:hypothetical protein
VERYEIIKVTEFDFALAAEIADKKTKEKIRLVAVYGPAHDDKREQFLSKLSGICAKDDVPTLLGGDFNTLRYSSEKTNSLVVIDTVTCSIG